MQNNQDELIKLNKCINILLEENELLLNQLYLIDTSQERHIQTTQYTSQQINIILKNLQKTIEENLKLHKQIILQKNILQIEHSNSLSTQLGNILINGVHSINSFILMLIKLCKIWKSLTQKKYPSNFGGKNLKKVLDIYANDGIDAVEKLLNSEISSPIMRANVYTELARHLMSQNTLQAAALARFAWELDPQPYRLKWLAFRTYEAGDAITAEILLDMLPSNITISDSEKQHILRIHHDSYQKINILSKDKYNLILKNINI